MHIPESDNMQTYIKRSFIFLATKNYTCRQKKWKHRQRITV